MSQPELMHAVPAELLSAAEIASVSGNGPYSTGLPNRAYTSDAFFAWERENLFGKTWTAVVNTCAVSAPGDVKPITFLGHPMVLVRDKENTLRVFHNVCSHRGNELVWEAGNVGPRIRCPYHSWTYDLDGKLSGTPHVGGMGVHEAEGLCKRELGLREIRSAAWMGLVFVNLCANAPPFEDFIAPLQARINAFASPEQFAALRPASNHGTATIEFGGNWKLDIENNLEAYHLPWVHPDLNAISRIEDHYQFFGGDLFAGQGSRAYDHRRGIEPAFPEFEAWPAGVSEYPSLFPNVFLGLHCDHFWTRIVEPMSPGRTLDHFQLYYLGEGAASDEFEQVRETRFVAWRKVFDEDLGVVAGMQRGRASTAFTGGVFSPVMDEPSHYFAKWMVDRLRGAEI